EIVREDQEEERRHVLQNCRNFLDAARHDECFALLAKLQEQFPQDDEVTGLLENARKNHGAHRKSHALTEAKELLVRGLYDEAISLLTPLVQEFPDGPEIAELLETAQRDQREQRRQQSLTKARELLAARRHAECASLLMSLKEQYPGDEQIPKLLTAVMDDQVEQRKREGLGRARSLL